MMSFGLKGQSLGIFLLLLNCIILLLAVWLSYNSYQNIQSRDAIKHHKAATNEDARGFSKNKFNTTFDALWHHSVPASHTLVFHYTSHQGALNARKSGIPTQIRFNGVPLSLRQPHSTKDSDFDVFEELVPLEEKNSSLSTRTSEESQLQSPTTRKFPHEEVLVLSLPKQFLDPLPGYEDDDGLCMISAELLNAMRPTVFSAVVDSQPWLKGFVLLPPHCILRSFVLMDKRNNSSSQRHLSLSKSIYSSTTRTISQTSTKGNSIHGGRNSLTRLARTSEILSTSMQPRNSSEHRKQSLDDISPVEDLPVVFNLSKQINNENEHVITLTSIEQYVKAMSKIRQKSFERKFIPLYHYTSLNVASLIIHSGLRMSTQGQGDGGVYVSTQGPASYGLGTFDYESNIIKDCFGIERLDEYLGKGKLDVIIVYGCEAAVLQQAPGGRDNAKMISKSTFIDFSLQHHDGNYFLRPSRVLGAFYIDPLNPPSLNSLELVDDIKVEKNREHSVHEKLHSMELKHQENLNRVNNAIHVIWNSLHDVNVAHSNDKIPAWDGENKMKEEDDENKRRSSFNRWMSGKFFAGESSNQDVATHDIEMSIVSGDGEIVKNAMNPIRESLPSSLNTPIESGGAEDQVEFIEEEEEEEEGGGYL